MGEPEIDDATITAASMFAELLATARREIVTEVAAEYYQRGYNQCRDDTRRALAGLIADFKQTPTLSRDDTIAELDLPVRAYNCLKREGIHTIGNLLDTPDDFLTNIRNLGRKSIDLIDEALAGFYLKRGPFTDIQALGLPSGVLEPLRLHKVMTVEQFNYWTDERLRDIGLTEFDVELIRERLRGLDQPA